MRKYTYKVTLIVEVPAFEESDSRDMLEDAFGAGPVGDMDVIDAKFKLTEIEQSPLDL